jgi:hypothetical protein
MAGANGGPRWNDALLDRMRELGDPVADKPVAAVLERGGVEAVNAMMRTLVRVDQPVPGALPDEIRDYLVAGFKLERGGERAPFDIPDRLARNWDMVA